ncbi:MAG: DUF883 family protein [Proteobacteria bacterium]|nr:DUF883 family protein [Pseudomonadota bacterium]
MVTELNVKQGAVADVQGTLVRDLKRLVGDAEDLLREVANTGVDEIALARSRIDGRVAEAKARLGDARIAVAERARGAADATNEYVRENPWRVLAIAAVAGLVVGAILRRH